MLIQSKTASLASAELAVSVFCDKRVPRIILYESTAVVYMIYDVNFDSALFFITKISLFIKITLKTFLLQLIRSIMSLNNLFMALIFCIAVSSHHMQLSHCFAGFRCLIAPIRF